MNQSQLTNYPKKLQTSRNNLHVTASQSIENEIRRTLDNFNAHETSAYDQVLNERKLRYPKQGLGVEIRKPSHIRNSSSIASYHSGNSQASIDSKKKRKTSSKRQTSDNLKSEQLQSLFEQCITQSNDSSLRACLSLVKEAVFGRIASLENEIRGMRRLAYQNQEQAFAQIQRQTSVISQ